MLLPYNHFMRNPTLKDELKVKGLEDNYSFGFPLYTVGQTADILAFRAHDVPVGEDQVPHLEDDRHFAPDMALATALVNSGVLGDGLPGIEP